MKITIVKQTKERIPRQWIENCLDFFVQILSRKNRIPKSIKNQLIHKELVLVFIEKNKMIGMNKNFRNKNKVTDVLSFSSDDGECLGELIFCLQKIKQQSKDHHMSYKNELAYVLLHGLLHLLGFDHEKNKVQANQMFNLQDEIFNQLF